MSPNGQCKCGCGQTTSVATATRPAKGWVAGQHVDYIRGHHKRKTPHGALCTVEGCDRTPEAKGLCHSHFEYQRRTRKTPTRPFASRDPLIRFMAKVIKLEGSGHWMWQRATASEGKYGAFAYQGRSQPAHRVAWMLLRGPIPDGYEVDHLCRKTLCVNPSHLEPVPPKVNSMRSDSPAAQNGAKTHCKRGHEFTPENTYVMRSGGRMCRACQKRPEAVAYRRAWRVAQKTT